MPTLKLPDCEMFYRVDDFTDPWTKAPWVVLMHGVAESSDAWYGWIPHLARHYRVLRFDIRGFGRSSAMPRHYPWDLDQPGDDLLALTQALGIESFHLVAAKVGGTMALQFASRQPKPLRSLSVLGTPVVAANPDYSSREIDEHDVFCPFFFIR